MFILDYLHKFAVVPHEPLNKELRRYFKGGEIKKERNARKRMVWKHGKRYSIYTVTKQSIFIATEAEKG